MATDIPFKLLEINVISAQYLPPVSKMLRTFAVAWINPDHKLSTRIDHQGHTNPTWNYKLVFRVEDRFLRSERAAVTIEIYNVAWLRDLPIGTAHLMINQLSPPLVHSSTTMRTVSLNICRPSGHMQGILNVGVNVLDNGINPSNISSPNELSLLSAENDRGLNEQKPQVEENGSQNHGKIDKKYSQGDRSSSIDEKIKFFEDELYRPGAEGSLLGISTSNDNLLELKVRTKANNLSSLGSMASAMKPLPSEVAANLKKGMYSTAGDDYGSSIFDNWSAPAPDDNNRDGLKSRSIRWRIHDETRLTINDHESKKQSKKHQPKQRNYSDGGGLFSCFGKGFECTFICGSGNIRRNRSKIHCPQPYHFPYPEDDLRRYYT